MSFIWQASASLAFFVTAAFVLYIVSITVHFRRRPIVLSQGEVQGFEWHVMVPALNEAAVIERTLVGLVELGRASGAVVQLWVVDDGSDDGTGAIVAGLSQHCPELHLVSRRLPEARTGKSDVLNCAYRRIVAWRAAQPASLPPERCVVGVVDADGTLDGDTLAVLAGAWCFAEPVVGAVQQDVHIRPLPVGSGRGERLLVTMQDVEFRASIAAIQHARHVSRSVSLGGNGQWTRLSALAEIAGDEGRPWRGSLLEDFELGLHLTMAGWVCRFTPGCAVSQEGLTSLRRLIRQRVRWCQGSMQCARYAPALMRSPFVTPGALVEYAYTLGQPWLWIAGTLVYPVPMISLARFALGRPAEWAHWLLYQSGWAFAVAFALLALVPLGSWGFTYRYALQRDEGRCLSRRRAAALGLAYCAFVHLSYVVAWRSLARLFAGRGGWVKSNRNTETTKQLIETASAQTGT